MVGPRKLKGLSYQYKFFGLVFHSNRPLPGIPRDENPAEKRDLGLHLGVAPYAESRNERASEELTYASSETNDKGDAVLQVWRVKQGAFVRMQYEDATQFWLDQSCENIWATWPDRSPFENMTSYLLGPVLGLLLRLRGVICLHASAVSIEGRAIAFVGPPGAGKSTTAAACSKKGHAVLADDIVAMEERDESFYALASHPELRLWPESVKLLYGHAEALQRLNPEWDKRRLWLGDLGVRFEHRTLPLGAIYILGDCRPAHAPYVEPLESREALLSLVAETYANKILDRDLRAREFETLRPLVVSVPMHRLFAHSDPPRIQNLCTVIETDLAALLSLKAPSS